MKDVLSRAYWSVNQEQVRALANFIPVARPPGAPETSMVAIGYIGSLPVYQIDKDQLTKEFNEFLHNENLQLLDKIQDLEAELHNTQWNYGCLPEDPEDKEFFDDYKKRGW